MRWTIASRTAISARSPARVDDPILVPGEKFKRDGMFAQFGVPPGSFLKQGSGRCQRARVRTGVER